MAESSWPTGGAGVRAVNESQYEDLASLWGEDGLKSSPADTSLVYGDSSGRQVKVRANRVAQIRGWGWTSGTSDFIKSVTANSSGSTRIDLVVLRLDRTAYTVTVQVIAGTPGAGSPPALTRTTGTTGTFDIPLASVTVVNGAATISASDVVDCAPRVGYPQIIYVPDTNALTRLTWVTHGQPARLWTGSAWRDFIYTSGTGWRPPLLFGLVNKTGSNQNLTSGVENYVSWTAATAYTASGMWSAGSPTRFTLPVAGTYRLVFRANASMTSSGALCWFKLNGTATRLGANACAAGGWGTGLFLDYQGDFNASDYVEATVFQNTGSTGTLATADNPQMIVSQIA